MAMGLSYLGRGTAQQLESAALHVLGSALAGGATGWAAGQVGATLGLERFRWVIPVVVVLAIVLLQRSGVRSWGMNRQVPKAFRRIRSVPLTFLLWGLWLGAGVATLIPYSAYLILVAYQLGAGPTMALLSGVLFGLGRSAVALAMAGAPQASHDDAARWLEVFRVAARRSNSALVMVAGVVPVIVLVAG
jgi:hypothetical protein